MFLGFVTLNDTFAGLLLALDSSGSPKDADSPPGYRVYDDNGLVVSGNAALKNSGAITGATNVSPIVVTSANHGLTTGTRVTISGVLGNTGANGTFIVTRIDANTFSLNGSSGTGAYTSGGTWHMSGLYGYSFAASSVNGFSAGKMYSVLSSYAVSSVSQGQLDTFQVQ